MKRIICTVTNDLSYDQRMTRSCSSLAKAGFQVHLLGRLRRYSQPLTHQPFEQQRLRCWFEKGKFFYLEYNIRLFFYLLFAKFDLVCAVDLDTILPGLIVSKIRRKPCVYDAHEYFTETPEVVRRPMIKRIWELVARFAIPRVNAAYTVGESLAEIFERRYGKPFGVVRNVPFRQDEIAQPDRTKPPIVLYQGALNEGRCLESTIQAMQFIEGAELWLAGEGDCSDTLRQMTTQLKLQHKVKFLGYLHPEDLRKVTLQATIGLNLLENKGLSYYYSLANKAFDYIQAGLPSIHMRFPEYEKINTQYSPFLLLEQGDARTIAHAIQQLLQDVTLYQQLRTSCLQARHLFTWEKEEAKLLATYDIFIEAEKAKSET